MATPTYIALATTTLSGGETSVTLSSIPTSGYRDLILVIAGSASTGAGLRVRLNGDTGSNYTYVYMQGSSGGVASNSGTNSWVDSFISTDQCTTIHQFLDGNATDKHKTVLSTRSIGGSDVMRLAQRWANTSAISSMLVYFSNSATFTAGTTISLFGVEA